MHFNIAAVLGRQDAFAAARSTLGCGPSLTIGKREVQLGATVVAGPVALDAIELVRPQTLINTPVPKQ